MNRLGCFLLLLPALGFSADKALIVGVGNFQIGCAPNVKPSYEHPCVNNLPGIDKDAQRMRTLALDMGIPQSQIHMLQDQQGTLAAVQSELNGWLREGVGSQDRVLIYFSTHGSRSTSKVTGGAIGVVATYDMHFVQAGPGTLVLDGALPGPELAHAIETNPSRNVFLIVDACESAGLTTDKSLNRAFQNRFISYPGIPDDPGGDLLRGAFTQKGERQKVNYAYLAAAARDESAVGDGAGGFMSLGMDQGLRTLAQQRQTASLAGAMPYITGFIKQKMAGEPKMQHPELLGDPRLVNADLLARGGAGGGPAPGPPPATQLWSELENVLQHSAGNLEIGGVQGAYPKDDTSMHVSINIPRDGYIYILSVGEGDDSIMELFPNQMDPQNHVAAGPVSIPKSGAPKEWHIRQGLANGVAEQKVLVVALWSESPNLLKDLTSGPGPFKDVELPVSTSKSPFPEEASAGGSEGGGYLAGGATYVIKGQP